ncbi:MAG: hypothetical protein HC938_14705 [Nitrospira sp.]|nr:hypothetical protein [Nitrospira sp.]
MGNTGLRPDESARLELRDVKIVNDESTGERILEIAVRGKRGVGFCKSMPGAILPFERISRRKGLKPTDRIFGKTPRDLMNTLLRRTESRSLTVMAMSAPVTVCGIQYICLRLLERS